MKKITMALAGALVFAMAGQVHATALETSGEIRARGWYLQNYAGLKTLEMWDQRLRVNLDWAVAENVKVHARADILEGQWGFSGTGTNNTASLANVGTVQIAFDHANMTFLWPDTPLTFILGRQDVSWGTGFDTQADNRDRFKVASKFGDISVAFAYDKNVETFLDHATKDDNRAWSVGAVIPAGGFKVGLLAAYLIDSTLTAPATLEKNFVKGNAWVMGKVANVDLKGEFTYLSGNSGVKNADGGKQKLTGIGAYLGAFMPVGPVKLGLEGAYAAGNDPTTAGTNEGGFSSDYQGPFWSVIFYQNMDYPGLTGGGQTSDTSSKDSQVTNAMGGKFSAVMSPMKGLTAIANVLYVNADKVAAGASKAMGTEIDLVFVYGITDNVSLTAGVGYAMLGDYFKDAAGKKSDNPLGTVASFNLKF